MDSVNLVLLTNLNSDIYKGGGGDDKVSSALVDIIKWVGGIGGLILTLAILIIAIMIMTKSVSPKNIGTAWTALFSCLGGAILFYSAVFLAPTVANIMN